jgi:GT2 family glycosyltransferase
MLDVSVIIPFKNKALMTVDCVGSLFRHGPAVREVLLVSNNSSREELALVEDAVGAAGTARIVEYNRPFNYQKMMNWAVSKTSGNSLLFLNNDTELVPQSRGLLERMFEQAARPDTGAVGCLLLYGDGATVQHAGVYLVPGGLAEHLYVGQNLKSLLKGIARKQLKYDITREMVMSAVTGAVTLVQRGKFESVGGYDERFIICGGDVDLCLRLSRAGYKTLLAGGTEYIIHKESQSRRHKAIPYADFYHSYLSYLAGYDRQLGDAYIN